MKCPPYIELGHGRSAIRFPILYEDRSVVAIDKAAGWMLVPFSWQATRCNLQAAITSSVAARDFWSKSRNIKYLRHVHRLDADTTGILLLAKSQGALRTYADLFESRRMGKTYLAVVHGVPPRPEWSCRARVGPDPDRVGRMRVDPSHGKPAETAFRLVRHTSHGSLIEARPITGRTHQIRLHLAHVHLPIVGDDLYGSPASVGRCTDPVHDSRFPLGLRAIGLEYFDPFCRRPVRISAPAEDFLRAFGLADVPLGSTSWVRAGEHDGSPA